MKESKRDGGRDEPGKRKINGRKRDEKGRTRNGPREGARSCVDIQRLPMYLRSLSNCISERRMVRPITFSFRDEPHHPVFFLMILNPPYSCATPPTHTHTPQFLLKITRHDSTTAIQQFVILSHKNEHLLFSKTPSFFQTRPL